MKKNKLCGYDVQKIERVKVNEVANIKSDEGFEMTGEFYDILGDEKKKKKGKKKNHVFTILIIFLVIFGIGGLGFFAYIKVYFTADRFLDNIAKDYNTYIENLNINANYEPYNLDEGYELSGEFNFTSNMPIYENLNTLNFIYDTYFDFSEEKAYYDLALEHDSEVLLNGEMYIDKTNFYYSFPQIFLRTLYTNSEETPFTMNTSDIDIIKLLEVPKYFLEALEYADKNTINKGLTNIYRYEINDSNKETIINKFKDLIKDNDFVYLIISSMYGDDWLDNITLENLTLEIEVNVITQDIVSFTFNGYEDSFHGLWETDNKFRVTDSAGDYIDINIYEDRCNITFIVDGASYGQINTTYNENEINISIIIEDITLEINLTANNDNSSNIYANMTYLDTSIILNLDTTTQNDKINASGSINIEYAGATLGIEFDTSATFGVSVPIKKYDDYVDVDKLAEEEANEIADGLNELLNNLPDELTYLILIGVSPEEPSEEITEQTV